MTDLAEELQSKVESLGRPIHIHLMDSQDRRLVHMALMENAKAKTSGSGEKQFRVLIVEPRKES